MEHDGEQEKRGQSGETEREKDRPTVPGLVDDAFMEFVKKGGLDTLTGKGKPLKLQSGDPLQHVLKEANVLPKWLMLQKEIRGELLALITASDRDPAADTAARIEQINRKITAYNKIVPTPFLQKMKITAADFKQQYSKWE
ncbi:DnaJ family domain-containing protein [Paenibacillus humicola]|uniref:DnaJ family domain-containing protein n=1 Tax=Paenibacillus humicola TaxID=3110540 RepID=UPI00237BC177|nr:DnaJ family domain-containing protein [Paenibacillus humicola]